MAIISQFQEELSKIIAKIPKYKIDFSFTNFLPKYTTIGQYIMAAGKAFNAVDLSVTPIKSKKDFGNEKKAVS